MGNTPSSCSTTCNYEDIQKGIGNKSRLVIHIMENDSLLISGTTTIDKETAIIDRLLNDREYDTNIIVYGKTQMIMRG